MNIDGLRHRLLNLRSYMLLHAKPSPLASEHLQHCTGVLSELLEYLDGTTVYVIQDRYCSTTTTDIVGYVRQWQDEVPGTKELLDAGDDSEAVNWYFEHHPNETYTHIPMDDFLNE